MDPPKTDSVKLSDMIMCGDHPSVTKTELNEKLEELETDQVKEPRDFPSSINPTVSRTDGPQSPPAVARSEQALRVRRRARSTELMQGAEVEVASAGNRALVQAALGSFRWPPYLLGVWVLVLVLTHALHCLVTLLERTLPALRQLTQYFRNWTFQAWQSEPQMNKRLFPASLACVTGLLYSLYFALYSLYVVVVWAIEPLYSDDERNSDVEAKVTNYIEDLAKPQ